MVIAAAAPPGLFLNILRVQNLRGGQGRLEVPVAPADSLYALFEHVRGVPSHEGGVPLFKLRVLDKLIDRLLAEGQPVPEAAHLSGLAPEQAESLIGELGGRLQRRLAGLAALSSGFARPIGGFARQISGFAPETGMLVDLVA
jgi:hypothetical protein